MARTDDDIWDITESVGTTALGVAASRSAETESANPLIHDPFARVFLDTVGPGMWTMWSPSGLPPEIVEAEPDLPVRMRSMVDYIASRTAFFDDFFLDATGAGVRQVVILAAGLDARVWRLPWPDGTTVYELDLPKVLEFKTETLRRHGAATTANRVDVPVDLRQDWPEALQQAGFDAAAPSVWSAEGLLPFLPATAQDLLFERVQALSVAGSRIAVEALGPDFNDPDARARQRALMQRYRDLAATVQGVGEVPDFDDLWYFEDRADVADWLQANGWRVTSVTAEQLLARYDRHPPEGIEDPLPRNLFVSAQRSVDEY
jgi:methyltransferase (TIGR00027 family)